MKTKRALMQIVALVALVLVFPGLAAACPVCFASSGSGTLYGFYLSTILLSAMPFVLVALVAYCAFAARPTGEATGHAPTNMRADEDA